MDGSAERRFERIEALQQDGSIGILTACKRIEDTAEVAFLALHFVDETRSRLLFADEAGGVGFHETHRIDGDPSGRKQDQDQEAGRQDRQEVPSRLPLIDHTLSLAQGAPLNRAYVATERKQRASRGV